jgi:hypothetical protein
MTSEVASQIINTYKNDLYRQKFNPTRGRPFGGSPFAYQIEGKDRSCFKKPPSFLSHIKEGMFQVDQYGFSSLKNYPMKGDLYRAGLKNKVKDLGMNVNRVSPSSITLQQNLTQSIREKSIYDSVVYIPSILAKYVTSRASGKAPEFTDTELIYLKDLDLKSESEITALIQKLPPDIKANILSIKEEKEEDPTTPILTPISIPTGTPIPTPVPSPSGTPITSPVPSPAPTAPSSPRGNLPGYVPRDLITVPLDSWTPEEIKRASADEIDEALGVSPTLSSLTYESLITAGSDTADIKSGVEKIFGGAPIAGLRQDPSGNPIMIVFSSVWARFISKHKHKGFSLIFNPPAIIRI